MYVPFPCNFLSESFMAAHGLVSALIFNKPSAIGMPVAGLHLDTPLA